MVSLKIYSQVLMFGLTAASTLRRSQVTSRDNTTEPYRFGIILYPAYTELDIFGPLESLTQYSWSHHLELSIIAATLDPVSTKPRMPTIVALNSSVHFSVIPTHTFDTAPPLDVLLIPGGLGERSPVSELQPMIDFVAQRTPQVQYLLTVCTGAGIAARAGVLDGKFATTNKRSFAEMKTRSNKVKWVAKARWVVDGNVWTSSGVQAGMDLMNAWITHVWGKDAAKGLQAGMEYTPELNARNDAWSEYNNLTSIYDELVRPDGRIRKV